MLSFIGVVSFISLFAVANEKSSLYVPPELAESIKKDFNIKPRDDIDFVLKPMTLVVHAGRHEYKRLVNGRGESVDFADFGKKPKYFTLQFEVEPAAAKPLVGEIHKEEPAKEEPAEHGAPSEHAAPSGHGGEEAKAGPLKALYFINRYREVQLGGRSFGLPCGKVLKIQSRLDELFTTQGIKVNSAGGRHLDTFGGDFLLVRREGDDMIVSSFKLKDSRYADRLCKMSFQ